MSRALPHWNSTSFAAASCLNHLLKVCQREGRVGDWSGVCEGLRGGLRKDVFVEGAGRGEGSVFDVYFIYQLHTHQELSTKTMSYDSQPELAPHSTDTRPVRRTPHLATHYTQPFPESLAGC